jgi:hypothetical protein
MQQDILRHDESFENVTEVAIPEMGVMIKITPLAEHTYGTADFVLTVSDQDSGSVFKKIGSKDLCNLIERQHRLIQAFSM